MTMEGLGIAANLMGIIDTSSKIIGVCVQYAQDVKHAKEDKARLTKEVSRLSLTLRNAKDLLASPRGAHLRNSSSLMQAVSDSEDLLRHLGKLLISEKGAHLERLKWPFQSKELNNIVQSLQRCSAAVDAALQVDQTLVSHPSLPILAFKLAN